MSIRAGRIARRQLTRHSIVHKRRPEHKTIIKHTARVLPPQRLKPNARIDATHARRDIRRHKVVEGDPHPLRGRSTPAVYSWLPNLGHVVAAERNGRREVRGVGAPVVDEDMLEERRLGHWVVEGGEGSVGREGERYEAYKEAHFVDDVVLVRGVLSGLEGLCMA